MIHSFNVKVAEALGVNKAILLNYIDFWVKKNQANRLHLHAGYYYTYNTYEAFAELFPYLGIRTIKRCLQELEKDGYIKTAQLSVNKWDKTKYYTISMKYEMWVSSNLADGDKMALSMGTEWDDDIQSIPVISSKPKIKNLGHSSLQSLRVDNEKELRYLPATTLGSPVTEQEAYYALEIITRYNEIRELYTEKKNKRYPQRTSAFFTNVATMLVDGMTIEEFADATHKMFESEHHKENKWAWLTLEFCTRGTKLEMYQSA